MYHGALVSGFVNISVYFNKLVNNLNHLIDLFKKIKILLRERISQPLLHFQINC